MTSRKEKRKAQRMAEGPPQPQQPPPSQTQSPVRKVRGGIDGINGTLLDIDEKLGRIIELLEQRSEKER